MKILLALALLFLSPLARSEAIICPDGVTYGDATTADCPVNSTAPSITDIAQTTATIVATADAQATGGATGYFWVNSTQFPPGCTSLNYAYADLSSPTPSIKQAAIKARQKCMKWPDIVSGAGSPVAYGTAAITAGTYSMSVTGLTEGQIYYAHHFIKGGIAGDDKIGVLETQTFTTNAAGSPPGESLVADSGAAPRYTGGGSNGNTGLSHAQRWADFTNISNVGLPAGTNIGLFNTTTFTNKELKVTYAGTSVDRNVIGSYKLNGSSVPIWTVDGVYGLGTTDTKAVIEGGLTQACLTAGSCNYTGVFPEDTYSSKYDAIVNIAETADYTTLQNIEIRFTRYYPMILGSSYGTTLTNLIMEGVDIHDVGANFYLVGGRDAIIRNNTMYNYSTCTMQKNQSGATGDTTGCNITGVYAGVQIIRSQRVLVENNVVYDGWGECLNSYNDSRYVIFRGNTVGDCRSVGIYVDASSYTVIENNILVGNSANTVGYSTVVDTRRRGIEINFEWPGSLYPGNNINQVVRNNLVVNASTCIEGGWAFEFQTGVADSGFTKSLTAWISGNTCIGTVSTENVLDRYSNPGSRTAIWLFKNNAHWSTEAGAASCSIRNQNVNTTGAYNHWFTSQTDADCTNNQSTGDPTLTLSTYATWQARSISGTWPTFADANPGGGSALEDTGTALTTPRLDISLFGIAWTSIAEVVAGTLTEAEWECENCVDALGVTRADPPNKGAVE